ncbi:MAG: RepB family DNA primase [Actinomycetota bacterium]|nr:RepB family DNA primase [Actinomycetota bacterium]
MGGGVRDPAAREEPEAGKRAVRGGSVLWVDLDSAEPDLAAESGALRPPLWLHSGAGHHLYWRLDDDAEAPEVESLNRRLCHRLGGDMACTERGRIMRLPGTFTAKRGRWSAALWADLSRPPISPNALREALPDPQPPRPP